MRDCPLVPGPRSLYSESHQMSLTGSLATMPLAEVFGWIGATNRLGVLTVRDEGAETMLDVRRGRVVECAASDPPVLLGQFLLFYGVITEEVLDRAMRAHATQSRRLGEVLMDMGAVSSENMEELLTAKAEETVLCSFDQKISSEAFIKQDAVKLERNWLLALYAESSLLETPRHHGLIN